MGGQHQRTCFIHVGLILIISGLKVFLEDFQVRVLLVNKGKAILKYLRGSVKMTIESSVCSGYAPWAPIYAVLLIYIVVLQ